MKRKSTEDVTSRPTELIRTELQSSDNQSILTCDLKLLQLAIYQSESRFDNGVFSNDLSHTLWSGIGHVLEYIDQVLKIHSF